VQGLLTNAYQVQARPLDYKQRYEPDKEHDNSKRATRGEQAWMRPLETPQGTPLSELARAAHMPPGAFAL
jgi:hypothetical protein